MMEDEHWVKIAGLCSYYCDPILRCDHDYVRVYFPGSRKEMSQTKRNTELIERLNAKIRQAHKAFDVSPHCGTRTDTKKSEDRSDTEEKAKDDPNQQARKDVDMKKPEMQTEHSSEPLPMKKADKENRKSVLINRICENVSQLRNWLGEARLDHLEKMAEHIQKANAED